MSTEGQESGPEQERRRLRPSERRGEGQDESVRGEQARDSTNEEVRSELRELTEEERVAREARSESILGRTEDYVGSWAELQEGQSLTTRREASEFGRASDAGESREATDSREVRDSRETGLRRENWRQEGQPTSRMTNERPTYSSSRASVQINVTPFEGSTGGAVHAWIIEG